MPGGNNMQRRFAGTHAAGVEGAARRTVLQGVLAVLTAVPLAGLRTRHAAAAEQAVVIPAPAADAVPAGGLQAAVLAGGCFWGVQAVYQHTKGVTNAVSGYAGGRSEDANYTTVSFGRTGHAESVRVTFDPRVTSYGK